MPGVTIASLRPLFYQWTDRAFNDRWFSAFQLAQHPANDIRSRLDALMHPE